MAIHPGFPVYITGAYRIEGKVQSVKMVKFRAYVNAPVMALTQ
jgi:hypothetical protein